MGLFYTNRKVIMTNMYTRVHLMQIERLWEVSFVHFVWEMTKTLPTYQWITSPNYSPYQAYKLCVFDANRKVMNKCLSVLMQFVEEMGKISKSSIWTTWFKAINIIFHSCVCKCNVHGNFQGGATMDLLEW